MQRKNKHIQLNRFCNIPVKAVFNYCMITLLAIVFSCNQFAGFANIQSAQINAPENCVAFQTEQVFFVTHFSSQIPLKSLPTGQNMEAGVLEEDDVKNNLDEYCHQIAQKYSAAELLYSTVLRSRYLQIKSSVYNRSTVPFFILHHSWKSYLS